MFYRIDLDHDHYGLEKLKKRVIEYLAVRKLKNSLKGKILVMTEDTKLIILVQMYVKEIYSQASPQEPPWGQRKVAIVERWLLVEVRL